MSTEIQWGRSEVSGRAARREETDMKHKPIYAASLRWLSRSWQLFYQGCGFSFTALRILNDTQLKTVVGELIACLADLIQGETNAFCRESVSKPLVSNWQAGTKTRLDKNYGLVDGIKGNTNTPPPKAGANASMPQRDKALSAVPSTFSWNSPMSWLFLVLSFPTLSQIIPVGCRNLIFPCWLHWDMTHTHMFVWSLQVKIRQTCSNAQGYRK